MQHAHGQPRSTSGNIRALQLSGALTGVYFIIELFIGLKYGSVAVVSDAFHTFSAVGGVLVALVAGRLAQRPASRVASFGWIRAEIVGALMNGLFLFGMAVFVIWMGVMRLMDPLPVEAGPMLWAAGGGLLTELVALRLLYQRQKGNLNMQGAFWHVIQTFVGSLLIIVAAIVIHLTGFIAIDPILGILFGVILVWASWRITSDSLRILLQAVPDDIDLGAVKSRVEELPGVRNAHHLHAWALTTGRNIASMHVLVEPDIDSEDLLDRIYELLDNEFQVYFATVQLEQRCRESGPAAAIADAVSPEP